MVKHGDARTKLNKVWRNMKDRCYNLHNKRYSHYGARGITVCDEWRNDYAKFKQWAIDNGYSAGLSLDRINNDGNYCPNNCRWVNSVTQNNNFSRNHFVTYNGITLSISQWAKKTGIPRNTLDWRIAKGWDIGKALNFPATIQLGDAFQVREENWKI